MTPEQRLADEASADAYRRRVAPLLGLVPDVCPCCSNGRPTCTDTRPDGSRYTHAETCATYSWSTDLCPACDAADKEHR